MFRYMICQSIYIYRCNIYGDQVKENNIIL